MNLSLRQAVSEPMLNLLQTAFEEGFKLHMSNPNATLEELPKIIVKRPQLRNEIISLGNEREEENLRAMRKANS